MVKEFIITSFPIIGLAIAIWSIISISTLLIPQQYAETTGRPKDGFTKLRWDILKMLLYIVMSLSLPLLYRFVRLFRGDSEILRSISSLSSDIGVYLFVSTLKRIFRYKYKKDLENYEKEEDING